MSFHPGKSLETTLRRIRPFLVPAYRRAFTGLVTRGLSQRRPGEPLVCCDFENPAIDAVGGRYYFSLVRDLIDAGYFPVFIAHRATLSTFGTSRMKSLLLTERLGVVRSLEEFNEPYFLITDRDQPKPAKVLRMVKVSYEQRLCRNDEEIAFPVFVHPQITTKVRLPFLYDIEAPRPARIFFGGNTEAGKYDKDVISEVYHMMSRRDVLAQAIAAVAAETVHRPTDAADWLDSNGFHSFVLCETQHCRIPQERWLEALAKADFFLACPGVGMPLCHNLIEAMAAGAIPILQYAAYLDPELKDGINCLAFHDENSLRELVGRAISMDPAEVIKLRHGVQSYYASHHAPGSFTTRLLHNTTDATVLLINSYRVPRT